MFIPAAAAFSALVGLIIVRRELRNAPEGFEDEKGFHLIRGGSERNYFSVKSLFLHGSVTRMFDGSGKGTRALLSDKRNRV
jgi:hypothetical protein